jgi:beta-glucanase (GH16 family)
MKNLRILSAIIIVISLGCAASKKTLQNTNSFVDAETPKTSKPLIIDTTSGKIDERQWVLDFSDEFNDTIIDKKKWAIENGTKKRVDMTNYSNDKQVIEKNGNAYIHYSKAPEIHDTAYYAGRFNSQGKYATTYGFLETRIHLVKPNGYQTAFWMMPNGGTSMSNAGPHDGTANDGAEIDIVEGNKLLTYSYGLHWDGYAKGTHKGAGGAKPKLRDLYEVEYHVFGLEWSPTSLKFYYDGKVIKEMTDPKAIPKVDHYIYFSGSCFGKNDWLEGDVRKNEFIQNGGVDKGYIDYVRVYKLKGL